MRSRCIPKVIAVARLAMTQKQKMGGGALRRHPSSVNKKDKGCKSLVFK